MSNALPDHAKKNPTQHNIEAIAKLEQDALERRTIAERISEAIAKFIGSVAFLLLQLLLVLTWSAINLNVIPGVRPFDPFPFGMDNWVNTLVRHILLAEPLVDDFKACFQGVKPAEAAKLADAFRLDACVRRARLLEILRADAAG